MKERKKEEEERLDGLMAVNADKRLAQRNKMDIKQPNTC